MNMVKSLSAEEIASLLTLHNFEGLYALAHQIQLQSFGSGIQLHAQLTLSNHCRRSCRYCALNYQNHAISRYRLTPEAAVDAAKRIYAAGYRVLHLRSADDLSYSPQTLCEIASEIKKTGLTLVLSLGQMHPDDLRELSKTGAECYSLTFETADASLYRNLRPGCELPERIQSLETLRSLGFTTGSGFLLGLPGQTTAILAENILLLKRLRCQLASIGPFLPQPGTPLSSCPPGDLEESMRCLALSRILCPKLTLFPSVSFSHFGEQALLRAVTYGANALLHDFSETAVAEQGESLSSLITAAFTAQSDFLQQNGFSYDIPSLA